MTGFMDVLNSLSPRLLSLLPATVIKSAVVFAVVLTLVKLVKRLHPKSKYLLWLLLFASLVVIPVFSTLVDSFDVRISRVIRNKRTSQTLTKIASPLSMDFDSIGSGATDRGNKTPAKPLLRASAVKTARGPLADISWPSAGLGVWIIGILLSFSKPCVGVVRLARLRKTAHSAGSAKHGSLLGELACETGIRDGIRMLQSDQCRVPFTCGVFRRFVVFPSDMGKWPTTRLRTVVRHELVHIKRRDYAMKLLARSICSLFWFVPFVWIAYAYLCAEQEQACDAAIVESGENPARYARELIRIARIARERLLAPSFLAPGQHKRFLRKRILGILNLKGGGKMKTKTMLYALVFLVAVLAGVGSFAADTGRSEFYVPSKNEELYGTWVNTNYTSGTNNFPPKIVYHNWGYFEWWNLLTDKNPLGRQTFIIVDKWTDSEGTIWYKEFAQMPGLIPQYYLDKLSENGTVLEQVRSETNFPTETDLTKKSINYVIYYKKS